MHIPVVNGCVDQSPPHTHTHLQYDKSHCFMAQVIGLKSFVPRAEQRWQKSNCVFPGHKPAEQLPSRWMGPLTDVLQILHFLGKINSIHFFFSLHHCLQLPTVYHSLSYTICMTILTLTVHKQCFPADNWNVCGATQWW